MSSKYLTLFSYIKFQSKTKTSEAYNKGVSFILSSSFVIKLCKKCVDFMELICTNVDNYTLLFLPIDGVSVVTKMAKEGSANA
jgi:dimeric dUTPase (all-alpha-NTP-PPase superfamily)